MAGLVPAIHVLGTEKKDVDARDKPGHDDVEAQCLFRLRTLLRAATARLRLAVPDQAVDVHADVGSRGGGIGQCDGAVEGDTGFVVAAELHQEGAAYAVEMKIVGELRRLPD